MGYEPGKRVRRVAHRTGTVTSPGGASSRQFRREFSGFAAGRRTLGFEPAAEDGMPQTPVAGPALVMHPAIDDRLKPRSPLRTWHHRSGTLQRRQFSGPWTFDIDFSLIKAVRITEHRNVELRMDAFNALNHATFWSGDQNINSTQFGVIGSIFYPARIMQFGLSYKF